MKSKMRIFSQLVFLFIIVILWKIGKMQLWMGLFLLMVINALFVGRLYCGWFCPIHTLLLPVEWMKRRGKLIKRDIPEWARSPVLRYSILGLMLLTFAATVIRGVKLPLFLVLAPVAVVAALVFQPALWHRYLCPYGIILSLTSGKPYLGVRVKSQDCSFCGLCVRVCPAEAIRMRKEIHSAEINCRYCLECFLCQEACPCNSISFSKGERDIEACSSSDSNI